MGGSRRCIRTREPTTGPTQAAQPPTPLPPTVAEVQAEAGRVALELEISKPLLAPTYFADHSIRIADGTNSNMSRGLDDIIRSRAAGSCSARSTYCILHQLVVLPHLAPRMHFLPAMSPPPPPPPPSAPPARPPAKTRDVTQIAIPCKV